MEISDWSKLKIPAPTAVRYLPQTEREYLRFLFARMIGTGYCPHHDLGLEATYEALEFMYDTGEIKFTFEPTLVNEQVSLGRVMLHDQKIGAYQLVPGLKIQMVKPL